MSELYFIHFTVTLPTLKNVVRYTGDFVIKGLVISEFHCANLYIDCVQPE